MEGKSSNRELQSIVDAIGCSEVVESRIQLLDKLGDLDISEKSDFACLLQCLANLWEDYTCLDVIQCMLNKAILEVAVKHLGSGLSSCPAQYLELGTKASIWCGKHLKMTLMSTEESQEEEHSKLFFELLFNLLSFSAASFSALARYPVTVNQLSMNSIEKFILEQLSLTKDLVSEFKRIQLYGSEALKVSQEVIDSVIRLCGVQAGAVNWGSYDERFEDKNGIDCEVINVKDCVINIIKHAIEKLCEMGIIAADGGGSLVAILNLSWKGVVTLLQLGEGILAVKMNISDILVTLISLVNESIRCASEAWNSTLKETVSVTEARRTFLPIKFYLINAVKISSLYPCQAYLVYKELTFCILKISTFRISMCNEKLLKTASEVFTELLEKSSYDLLNSILISDQVKQECKFEILDCLFFHENDANLISGCLDECSRNTSINGSQVLPERGAMLLGRVALFLNFLRYSVDSEEDTRVGISRKLGWFLDLFVNEEVYSSILILQLPVSYGSGKTVEVIWQPMFSFLLNSLQTFLIVVSSSLAWMEVESFLLENLFHPHFLCWEVVMELWCFIARYAEPGMVNGIVNKLCSLLKFLASAESVFNPCSALRRLARFISMFLSFGAQSLVDQVINFIVGDERSAESSIVRLALLMEGFPLNLLSDKIRSITTQKVLTDYFVFVESFDEKSIRAGNNGFFGVPVFTLSASLQSLQINLSDVDVKTLKFLVSIIHSYKACADKLTKNHCRKLLSETLGIISNMKHLYASDEMEEVVFELGKLFISGPAATDKELYQCKPDLALFMAGLAHMHIPETDKNPKTSAAWQLYHMLLRERHWALIHLAITAFGYFTARTLCNELWRFVPHNAALSYDLESGIEAKEERFMFELKAFLDKERALHTITASSDQLELLAREGLMLKKLFQKLSAINAETAGCKSMDVDGENRSMEVDGEKQCNKKRKLPDGISKGMELLQSGLKVISDGISQLQQHQLSSIELNKFLTHFSRLEDQIAQLVGLTGND
ncbi:hypothetical protein FEM48_Zijuj07G0076600 [Ziziphus jujuba var. spinosa]|uniref:Uncharacterized protein n=1 Tax=Ziziphus jujuba var. spinosa TaxID=714518 RepID=A0A978V3C5_ZIZJJ|nr:hypothetical protein FEM48_Zijuj07G0076600 [Ziziphus jujuba var. spinosa]